MTKIRLVYAPLIFVVDTALTRGEAETTLYHFWVSDARAMRLPDADGGEVYAPKEGLLMAKILPTEAGR
jgi:hypothetical protein